MSRQQLVVGVLVLGLALLVSGAVAVRKQVRASLTAEPAE